MAKRKRLAPAKSSENPPDFPALETKSMTPPGFGGAARPPIAQVAGDASASAALRELSAEMQAAREDGRMVLDLPLGAVDAGYLVRDRLGADEEELQVLMTSIRERGQQTPIEVAALEGGGYGLISGWRRLTALKRLDEEQGEGRFATIRALLRRPDQAADAYRAMVEENEIRVGLSYYERARIVARAVEQGVYSDQPRALKQLFAAASRSKRSKIGSFLKVYNGLDTHLRFPTSINERLGLGLAAAIDKDPEFAERLDDRLRKNPASSAEEETALLEKSIRVKTPEKKTLTSALETNATPKDPVKRRLADGIDIELSDGRVTLSGQGVTPGFVEELRSWVGRSH